MIEDPKTYKAGEEKNDGKSWFEVTVRESYDQTYLVRALDHEEAQNTIDHLIDTEVLDPTEHGGYERSVDPSEAGRVPNEGETYWEDEDYPYAN